MKQICLSIISQSSRKENIPEEFTKLKQPKISSTESDYLIVHRKEGKSTITVTIFLIIVIILRAILSIEAIQGALLQNETI